MSSSIVIHVLRPYASEEEYLAHESFSIDARSMLLIEQAPLPPGTLIVFDVSLANGHKPIRAEGKVVEHVAGDSVQPGGLRVRFKRFGAATKAFIDRAVAASPPRSFAPAAPPPSVPSLLPAGYRTPSRAPSVPSRAPEAHAAPSAAPPTVPSRALEARTTPSVAPPSVPSRALEARTAPSVVPPSVPARTSEARTAPSVAPPTVPSRAPEARTAPSPAPASVPARTPQIAAQAPASSPEVSAPATLPATGTWPPPPRWNAKPELEESSGVHRKIVLPVAAPANREALLGRLRARRAS